MQNKFNELDQQDLSKKKNCVTGVLVIGSGGAGLTSAIWAKLQGADVTVVTKALPTQATTSQAQGGINAVISSEKDSIKNHIEDTLNASCGLGRKNAIEIMCNEAKDAIAWLDSIGVVFSKTKDGSFAQRKLGASTHARTCYGSDYTGLKILHTLYDYALGIGVKFLSDHYLLNLITDDGVVGGATFLDIATTNVIAIEAGSVVMATGGYCELYNGFSTSSSANTADGISTALRAGARLSNLEFVQFHPTTLKGSSVLISESARAQGGYLVDKDGNRFVDELCSRDVVSRAVYKKIEENQDVFLDMRHIDPLILEKTMPQEISLALAFEGIDIKNELTPIKPSAHYTMGGIVVDTHAKTNLKNFFACGECADAGIHGGNRLGGNSLLELIVFGKIAGINAANNALQSAPRFPNNSKQLDSDTKFIKSVFKLPNRINFYERKNFLGKIFYKNVGIFRIDANMKAVLQHVRQWQKEFLFMGISDKNTIYNTNLAEFIEFGNILEIAEAVVVSAISRCESRGAHFRVDFPAVNSDFASNSIISKQEGILVAEFVEGYI